MLDFCAQNQVLSEAIAGTRHETSTPNWRNVFISSFVHTGYLKPRNRRLNNILKGPLKSYKQIVGVWLATLTLA
jgi:hypothetical protein